MFSFLIFFISQNEVENNSLLVTSSLSSSQELFHVLYSLLVYSSFLSLLGGWWVPRAYYYVYVWACCIGHKETETFLTPFSYALRQEKSVRKSISNNWYMTSKFFRQELAAWKIVNLLCSTLGVRMLMFLMKPLKLGYVVIISE